MVRDIVCSTFAGLLRTCPPSASRRTDKPSSIGSSYIRARNALPIRESSLPTGLRFALHGHTWRRPATVSIVYSRGRVWLDCTDPKQPPADDEKNSYSSCSGAALAPRDIAAATHTERMDRILTCWRNNSLIQLLPWLAAAMVENQCDVTLGMRTVHWLPFRSRTVRNSINHTPSRNHSTSLIVTLAIHWR